MFREEAKDVSSLLGNERVLDAVQMTCSLVGMQGSWDAFPDLLPVSSPGMGPGAAATGHADGAGQWFAGCPAAHQKEPGEQILGEGVD